MLLCLAFVPWALVIGQVYLDKRWPLKERGFVIGAIVTLLNEFCGTAFLWVAMYLKERWITLPFVVICFIGGLVQMVFGTGRFWSAIESSKKEKEKEKEKENGKGKV